MANTGMKGYTTLLKFTTETIPRELDINNNLCSESLLPQDSKPNTVGDPNYVAPVSDTASCPTTPPPVTNSTIQLISQGVTDINGSTNPYPDGGGSFTYTVGICNVDFSTAGSNFVPGDILTVEFQANSSFAIHQCANITGGTTSPSGPIVLPNLSLMSMDVTYLAGSPIVQIILYTPRTQLQPTLSASSSMRLIRRNGASITFPSAADRGILNTPAAGGVTLNLD